jgi:hypothetical protein
MTEQPAEPTTEQQWLGNTRPSAYIPAVPGVRTGHLIDGPSIQGRPVADSRAERSPLVSKFLGLVDGAFDKAEQDLAGRRATDAGLRRLSRDVAAAEGQRIPTLDEQAQIAAGHAAEALSSGELDEGIAWLQTALAFAQNHRHAIRYEEAAQ